MNPIKSLGLLTATATLTLSAFSTPAIAQQRICIQSERDGRIVCGKRVNQNNYNNAQYDRYDNDRYAKYDRYDQSNRYGGKNSLSSCSNFDERFYRTAYSDVDAAIRQGRVDNACAHYLKYGRFEGRFPRFNEASYLSKNPDVANAIRKGQVRNGYDHWQKYGRYESRKL